MKVVLKSGAVKVINGIAQFVEAKNTPGSGKRYALKFKAAINRLVRNNISYSICNHYTLARFGYSCSLFNDWVIVFKVENDVLTVYRIVHSSTLS